MYREEGGDQVAYQAGGTDRFIEVGCTVPLKERHIERIRSAFPGVRIRLFADLEEAGRHLSDFEILITYGMDVEESHVERMTALRWVQVYSAGVERLPLEALDRRGVMVTNARGIHGVQMSEHTLGVMLMYTRRFLTFARQQAARVWDRRVRVDELQDKILAILGTGAIAVELARRAKALGMVVWGYNRSGRPVEGFDRVVSGREGLEELLAAGDFVVVLVPSTPETRRLIGREELRKMKPTAFLINLARGEVVDEEALVTALRDNWIGGAALDVFEEEPLPADHPFWELENCFITPHVSGLSPKYNERATDIFLRNLKTYVTGQGEWVNRVDPRKGY
ncbi:MAG: D-2-hydroxyacid dehydrogenase [Alicyclobacillaceae bacterium]|nr:D-2-hydroxyacid dehydrogenase [Alicyclobacillaceae bacterium]